MNLNEWAAGSSYFGIVLSLFAYWIGWRIQKKWKYVLLNPLLISIVLGIVFLTVTGISFETYREGAKYITYFLTPATVCLAVPLYKQVLILKENLDAVIVGITLGGVTNLVVVAAILLLFRIDRTLVVSMLPKSITTAIALGVCEQAGGIPAVTVIGITIAGLSGAVLGPGFLRFLRIREPVAQGLAVGTASHAMGTSRTVEMGEIQEAMSSLAIVVNGLLTAVLVPIMVRWMYGG